MDLVSRVHMIHVSSSSSLSPPLSPVTSPSNTVFIPHLHKSDSSFPIIAITVIGIVATAFLLVSYYIFVIKCCLNWHRIDILRRFSLSRSRRENEDSLIPAYSPATETRGLEQSAIRAIPVFQFRKMDLNEKTLHECAVCLNEFEEDEKLRRIPNCCHVFHIDCIDVWLQSNANCPLCRTSISISSAARFLPPFDHIINITPSPSPEDPNPYTSDENVINGDEDFVVIELGNRDRPPSGDRRSELSSQRSGNKKSGRKNHNKVISMGDECIDIRKKDDRFEIQPIRRSFSMDSSSDRKLFMAVQQLVQQKRQQNEVSPSPVEDSGSSSSSCSRGSKRSSFFTFGHGRGSRSASVLPVYLEP